MDEDWITITADDVRVGDRVRYRQEQEFTVARVDQRLLGRDDLVCLIEDTPQRWQAYPARRNDPIERAPT